MASPCPAALFPPASAQSLLDRIGNTPLLRLRRIGSQFPSVEIYAKAEFLNPGGSVKDRPALNIILEAERAGRLGPDRIILDATSGNTGIAYAMIAAARGYRLRICMPANASEERKRTLLAFGAELVLTDPAEGSDGAIRVCRQIYSSAPQLYFYADQYNNPANWKAHYHTTAVEILRQCRRGVTHFVAILGTSGTFTGVARRLKQELGPRVQCLAVQPASGFHGIEGAKRLASARFPPGIFDASLVDRTLYVETEEAQRMTLRLAREEGLLVGVSSGANLVACLRLAWELAAQGRSATIVTILPDSGGRYLSEEFWNASH